MLLAALFRPLDLFAAVDFFILEMMASASGLARLHHLALLLLAVHLNAAASQGKNAFPFRTRPFRSVFIHQCSQLLCVWLGRWGRLSFVLPMQKEPRGEVLAVFASGIFGSSFFFVLPLRVLSSSPSSNPVRGSLATVCCGILLIHNPPPPAFLFYVSQIYKVCPCVCVCDTRCQLTCHRFHVWPVAIVFASLFLSTFLATRFDPPLRRVYLNNNMEK